MITQSTLILEIIATAVITFSCAFFYSRISGIAPRIVLWFLFLWAVIFLIIGISRGRYEQTIQSKIYGPTFAIYNIGCRYNGIDNDRTSGKRHKSGVF